MRVAIFPSTIAPVAEGRCFGGAEIAALALAEALAARGDRVSLVGVAGSGGRGLSTVAVPGVAPFRPGEEVPEDPAPFLPIVERLRAFDVVHSHLNDPGALLALDALARSPGAPRVVATLHLSAVFPATTRVVRSLVAAGSPVRWVAPSAFAARSYGCGDAIAVVPNGVDADAVPFGERPRPDHLAWAARRVPEKGLDAAIAIAARAGCTLEVAGGGGPRREGVGVVDHGLLSRAEVGAMFARAAAVLITSSIAEAHPLVAIEALLAGAPVVGFAVGGLPEIVDDTCGVLVAPGDVEAAARAVTAVRALSRASCRASAARRFGHAAMVDAYRALFTRP